MEKAVGRGLDPSTAGVLVDEQFGGDVPKLAREHGLALSMPVEKSGQNEFDFQYGSEFGDHIESFDPQFSKVLVRLNPDGDAEMNERQLGRLKELADWLHQHDRKFLFELPVPAEDAQLESGRHRPLRRRAPARADAPCCWGAGRATRRSTTGCARPRPSRA